jgi:hypothetical protein
VSATALGSACRTESASESVGRGDSVVSDPASAWRCVGSGVSVAPSGVAVGQAVIRRFWRGRRCRDSLVDAVRNVVAVIVVKCRHCIDQSVPYGRQDRGPGPRRYIRLHASSRSAAHCDQRRSQCARSPSKSPQGV